MSDWQEVPLKEIALPGTENFIDGDWIEAPYIASTGLRLIQTGNIGVGIFRDKSKKYITEKTFTELRCKGVFSGDILICRLAEPAGRACVVPSVLEGVNITSVDVTIFRVNGELYDKSFIVHSINTQEFLDRCQEVAGGTTRTRISRSNLGALTLKCPPLPQQKKIARILTTVDNLIEQTQALIDKYTVIKQGMMADLFTRGLDITGTRETNPNYGQLRPSVEDAPELYKETELGWVPKEWEVQQLDSLTSKIIDGTHHTPTYTDEGVPFLRVTDIQTNEINFERIKFVSQVEHNQLVKRCNPERGDILYSKNGTIGIPKIVDWDWEFSVFVSLCLIKPLQDLINNVYLKTILDSDIAWRQIRRRAKQGTVTNLHLEEIREFLIPLPSIEEQIQITEKLSALARTVNTEKCKQDKLRKQKKGLMQDLLTGKVPVDA